MAAHYGSGGNFDHLYLHDISDDSAFACAVARAPRQYGPRHLPEQPHPVNNSPSGTAPAPMGSRAALDSTVRNSLLEGTRSAAVNPTQHQDLIQAQRRGSPCTAMSSRTAPTPLRLRLLQRLATQPLPHLQQRVHQGSRQRIHSVLLQWERRARPSTTSTSTTTPSLTLRSAEALPQVQFYSFRESYVTILRSRTMSSTTMTRVTEHRCESGFSAADWNVDYNNLSGGSRPMFVDGARHAQAHGSRCAPAFARYIKNATSLSQNYAQWGGTDLSLAAGDRCLANAGTSLANLFTIDKNGTSRPQGAAWDIGAYERVRTGRNDRLREVGPENHRALVACFVKSIEHLGAHRDGGPTDRSNGKRATNCDR